MKRLRSLIAAAALLIAQAIGGGAAMAAQNTVIMPTGGPMSMATFVTTYLNPGIQSLFTCNSGGSAPANGTGAAVETYQCWWDSSSNILRVYDGTSWVKVGSMDSGHLFAASVSGINDSTPSWSGLHQWIRSFTSSTADASDSITMTGTYNNQLSASGTVGYLLRLGQLVGTTAIEKGNVAAIGITQTIYNSAFVGGGGTTEHGPIVQWLNADPASTNHQVNYWGCDCNLTGPFSGQEGFMGYVWQLSKYSSGTTIDSTHFGSVGHAIITSPGGGVAARSGVTSYPLDAGIVVAGFSGASTVVTGSNASATNGYTIAFQAGGRATPWMDAATLSKIGTGFYARDIVNYAFRVGPRDANNTGQALYIESGAGGVGIGGVPVEGLPLNITTTNASLNGLGERIIYVENGAGSGPRLELYRISTTPAVADVIGRIAALGNDSNVAAADYAYMTAKIVSPTAGATTGSWLFGDASVDWLTVSAALISSASPVTFSSATIKMTTLGNAATTSAVCYNTGTGLLTYNGTVGTCTVSTLAAKNLKGPLSPREGFEIVMATEPYRYELKEGLPTYVPGEQIGMVAEFERDERLVARNADGSAGGFRYEQYTAALAAAFQYLKADNDNLHADNDNLRQEIKQIRIAR